jgi:hypothetical protein
MDLQLKDKRAWEHVHLYGCFDLDMNSRLAIL